MSNNPIGWRMHRDLRAADCASLTSAVRVPLGQLEPLGERRHRGRDVGRGKVADQAPGGREM